MAMQSAVNVLAAVKREISGTPGIAAAAGSGANQLRITDSPGLRLERNSIQSGEHRADQLRPMGRLGGRTVSGSYNAEMTVGGATDDFLEAIMRRVWSIALAISPATSGFTGATLTVAVGSTTSTITTSAGSWITAGLRIGDIITPTGMTTTANNSLRLRVVGLTATVITVAGLMTAGATASGWTITRLKKLTTVGLPTRYSYTVEQYDSDLDISELFLGCRLTSVAMAFRPNAIATIAYTFMGMDRTPLTTVTSPWFTSPSLTTGLPLVADDSAIRYNGADVTRFTSLDLTLAISAAGQPVIGSTVTPDIFDNDITISGSISGIREDFSRLTLFDAETEFDLSALFIEPGTDPDPCIGLYLPRVKFGGLDAPFRASEGPKIETLPLMVGPSSGGTTIDASGINIFSSAA